MLPEVSSLDKDQRGLTSEEAKSRLIKHGPNLLPERKPPSSLSILLSQLKNPLVYILVAAGIVTLSLQETSDSLIIFLAVVINTALGFVQESRASKSLEALRKLVHPTAKVVRDLQIVTANAEEIVPGDLVVLSQGDKVPADGRTVFANRLHLTEAILTGESAPVAKREGDEVFMGTSVLSGRGLFLVEGTGASTKIGEVAESVQEPSEDTPLRNQLKRFSGQLSLLVLGLTTLVFIIGLLTGLDAVDIFTTSVALAVSSIPEGLLVGLTVVLAIGMQRILKKKGLVRRLVSAETLGGVTTICLDKTGTLTKGEMEVVGVVGKESELAEQMLVANDFDDPMVIAGRDWAAKHFNKREEKRLMKKYERLDSIPFSPKTRFFVSLHRWNEKNRLIFVNGAPEVILEWSMVSGKKKFLKQIDELTSQGKRLVGLARKKVTISKKKLTIRDAKSGLEFVGIIAFEDPVRDGVKVSLEKTKNAGISLLVITGDYQETAKHVMRELGMINENDTVMTGRDIFKLNEEQLARKIREKAPKLFARTTPDQKLKIIEALKRNGEVVAMMGDGVNDAPALKRSDIGVVVGEASDVAKETADLVLLDSKFETVVSAIEEGRGIFDNLRKIILYLMSDAFEEIIAVLGTLVLGLPLPVSAAQILWINLVSDGFPDLALTIDPVEEGVMRRPPRPAWEPMVNRWMKALIAIVSAIGGLISLALFIQYYLLTGDLALARSIAFASLGLNSLVFIFSVRTLTQPFWAADPLENKWLNLAVGAGVVLQFLPFSTPRLREFFGLELPGLQPFFFVFLGSVLTFIIIEMIKALVRRHLSWFQH